MQTAHYLRFVQALVLAAAVPACAADAPEPSTPADPVAAPEQAGAEQTPEPGAQTEQPDEKQPVAQADAAPAEQPGEDAGVDADLPFSSGPIVPPELPASFA